jgi:hypothetical protein
MTDLRHVIERNTTDALGTSGLLFLYVVMSGIFWYLANDGFVDSPVGFDPLRYEYYARYGLPNEYIDSSSYRIVSYLQFIYRYLPFYWGHILSIFFVCFALRYFDKDKIVSITFRKPERMALLSSH